MINQLSSFISRILFIASFLLLGMAIWEKLANMMDLTLTRGFYSSWHILEISAIALLFVITLQLREIKISLTTK